MRLATLVLIPTLLMSNAAVDKNKVNQAINGYIAAITKPWHTVKASTYGVGDGLVGRGMADGHPLTLNELTIAINPTYAKTMRLPLGSRVVIRYNEKEVHATRTDSGPFYEDRMFDLGPAVARSLGFSGVNQIQWRKE